MIKVVSILEEVHCLEKDMKTVYDIHDKSYHGDKHRN